MMDYNNCEEEFEDDYLDPQMSSIPAPVQGQEVDQGLDEDQDQNQDQDQDSSSGFRFDPGWLFLLSGLVMLTAIILLPPSDDLVGLEYKHQLLIDQQHHALDRLEAYTNFLEALDNEDPVLVRRLAATHLNRIPANSEPVAMIGSDLDASVERWIAGTLPVSRDIPVPEFKDTYLRRICRKGSSGRLWIIGLSAILIIIGLMPGASARVMGRSI